MSTGSAPESSGSRRPAIGSRAPPGMRASGGVGEGGRWTADSEVVPVEVVLFDEDADGLEDSVEYAEEEFECVSHPLSWLGTAESSRGFRWGGDGMVRSRVKACLPSWEREKCGDRPSKRPVSGSLGARTEPSFIITYTVFLRHSRTSRGAPGARAHRRQAAPVIIVPQGRYFFRRPRVVRLRPFRGDVCVFWAFFGFDVVAASRRRFASRTPRPRRLIRAARFFSFGATSSVSQR